MLVKLLKKKNERVIAQVVGLQFGAEGTRVETWRMKSYESFNFLCTEYAEESNFMSFG